MVTIREGWGKGVVRELGMDMSTLLYLTRITNRDMELCSVLWGSLDGRGVWRRMDTCVCMTLLCV